MKTSIFKKLNLHLHKNRTKFDKQTLLRHWRLVLISYLILSILMIGVTILLLTDLQIKSDQKVSSQDQNELNDKKLDEVVKPQRFKNLVQKNLIEYGFDISHIKPPVNEDRSDELKSRPTNL